MLGADGQVGRAAISVALLKGARCIGLTRNLESIVKIPGCNYINYEGDLEATIKKAANGADVDVILNSLGTRYFNVLINSLSDEGRLVTIAATPGHREFTLNLFENYRANISLIGVNTGKLDQIKCAEILSNLREPFNEGKLSAPLVNKEMIFPIDRACDAYNIVRKGSRGKKVIISML